MKFTRKQELVLIDIGLNTLLKSAMNGYMSVEGESKSVIKPLHKKRTMSEAAKRKISRRMKKMWREKQASE